MPDGETVVKWEPNRFSNEKIKSPTTANDSLIPKLNWINDLKIRIEFKGNCLKQDKVAFTLRNATNLFILYKLDARSQDLKYNFTLKNCLFGAVKLTKNVDFF